MHKRNTSNFNNGPVLVARRHVRTFIMVRFYNVVIIHRLNVENAVGTCVSISLH